MITTKHTFGLGMIFVVIGTLMIVNGVNRHSWSWADAGLLVLLLGVLLISIEVVGKD